MKNGFKLVIALSFLTMGCALAQKYVVPVLENRTLEIAKDFPGFKYRYCVKWQFWTGKCKEYKVDIYDLNDTTTRLKLLHMGFVLKVREKL